MSPRRSHVISVRLAPFRRPSFVFVCGLLPLLAACSHGDASDQEAQARIEVSTAMPVRKTFHGQLAAFGQLGADNRNALSMSLPHPIQVVATEVLAGQRVKRGQVLLKLETDPATRSAYMKAQSALKVARADLTRTERLHSEKLATNAQLDAARKALADAQAAFEAQARLGGAQAASTLKAPADGVVTALPVQRGQRVAAGATLVQFSPASALAAQLGVDPAAAPAIRAGMPVTVHPVYASSSTPPLHATVAMVGDAVNPQTHLVDVVAPIGGPVPLLAGAALSATIQTSDFQAWAVPRGALQNGAGGDYLFQIEHGRAHRVNVKVVAPDGTPVGVEGALDAHAPVIVLGSYEVADGDPVRPNGKGASEP